MQYLTTVISKAKMESNKNILHKHSQNKHLSIFIAFILFPHNS